MRIQFAPRLAIAIAMAGALAFVVSLGACGRQETPTPTPSATTPAPAPATQPAAPSAAKAEVRGSGQLPEGFDVPIYPDATSTASMQLGPSSLTTFAAKASKDDVYDFYMEKLASAGWKVESENRDQGTLRAAKANRKATIRLNQKGDETEIGITLAGG